MFKKIIFGVGIFQIGYYGYYGFDYLQRYGWHQNCDLKKEIPSQYALVTGASSGLGFGYAQELASRGFNVILVARGSEKLEKSVESIREKHPNVKVVSKQLDLEKTGVEEAKKFLSDLKNEFGDEIGIFINSAAAFEKEAFQALSLQDIQRVINTNLIGNTLLLQQQLVYANSHADKKTLLINIGSQKASRDNSEEAVVYYATKQFQNHLLSNLVESYINSNVHIVNNAPGYLDSPMLAQFYPNFKKTLAGKFVDTPQRIAKQTLDQIDLKPSLINGTDKQVIGNIILKIQKQYNALI